MKNIITMLTISILLASCGATNTDEMQNDVNGLKVELKNKQNEMLILKAGIDSLKAQIVKLDPEFEKKEVPVVELLGLTREDFKHYVEVQGNIVAGEEKMISAELPGKITSLTINEGDNVRKGQLLATIDVETIENSIEELKKTMELANDLYDRQKRLWDQNIGSEIQYLQAKNNKERLEKTLATAQLSLKKSKIYAPMSGSVTMLLGKQGEMTSPGMPILKMMNTDVVKLKADVPEDHIRNVKMSDLVRVEIPVLDFEKEIRVSRIGNVINSNNRTFEVEVRLNNSNKELKPNLLAMLHINDYKSLDAVAVPLELVQQDVSGKKYIFTAKQEGDKYYVQKKIIETGVAYNGLIEIVKGLNGDEKLVSVGSQYLAEGDEITVNGVDSDNK